MSTNTLATAECRKFTNKWLTVIAVCSDERKAKKKNGKNGEIWIRPDKKNWRWIRYTITVLLLILMINGFFSFVRVNISNFKMILSKIKNNILYEKNEHNTRLPGYSQGLYKSMCSVAYNRTATCTLTLSNIWSCVCPTPRGLRFLPIKKIKHSCCG